MKVIYKITSKINPKKFYIGSAVNYENRVKRHVRHTMEDFKLKTVAKQLGIEIDESKLHDAEYDIYLTMEIHRIVTQKP